MPTPFYHLALAHAALAHPDLSEAARAHLTAHLGPFLLGNTAPDVQTVSGQPREATHFFDLPTAAPIPAWEPLFAAYPHLADAAALDPAHAAFLAGYLAHLLLDQLWIIHILVPYFYNDPTWPSRDDRRLWHNVLRAYLDAQCLPTLIGPTGAHLASATPHHWLPFTADEHLTTWRDFIANQLQPGQPSQTVAVLAERIGADPARFAAALADQAALQANLFGRYPLATHAQYRQHALTLTLRTLNAYLAGNLPAAHLRIE